MREIIVKCNFLVPFLKPERMSRVVALDNLLYLISGLYNGTDPYRKKN
jgi:hypothetical protein